MRTLSNVIIFSLMFCGCNKNCFRNECRTYSSNEKDYKLITNLLENIIEDSLLLREFTIQVKNHSYVMKDMRYKWEKEYSSDYFDIVIKSFTKDFVLIYCPRSGIQAGYKLFGKRKHDIYLVERKDGHIIKCIEIKKGLANGVIYKNAIFLEFLDPEEIRKCEFKKK